MNREEFLTRLEGMLQSISPTEKEEVLQYYRDYFEDAGPENEQSVIESLGNPADIAENIKKDLQGDDGSRATASDHAVMEYGSPEACERDNYNGSPKPVNGAITMTAGRHMLIRDTENRYRRRRECPGGQSCY